MTEHTLLGLCKIGVELARLGSDSEGTDSGRDRSQMDKEREHEMVDKLQRRSVRIL